MQNNGSAGYRDLHANLTSDRDGSADRAIVQGALDSSREAYDALLRKVAVGEIGPDNLLRAGERTGPLFAAADRRSVWAVVPDAKAVLRIDPAEVRVLERVQTDADVRLAHARAGYWICAVAAPAADDEGEARGARAGADAPCDALCREVSCQGHAYLPAAMPSPKPVDMPQISKGWGWKRTVLLPCVGQCASSGSAART